MTSDIGELLKYSKAQEERVGIDTKKIDLEDMIDKFLWQLNEDSTYNRESYGGEIEKGFHPSQIIGETCARKLFYDWVGAPHPEEAKDIDPKLRRIFDNGSGVHDRWQMYFALMSIKNDRFDLVGDWKCKGCGYKLSPAKETSIPVDLTKIDLNTGAAPYFECPTCGCRRWRYNEFRLRKKALRITGKRDGKIIINGKKYLLEIKSINMFQFQKLYVPKPDHKVQFSFYLFCDDEVDEGFFLYECKNTQNIKIFYHKYDSADISNELAVLRIVNLAIDDDKLPERLPDYPVGDKCKLCLYKSTCKSTLIPEKKT